MKVCFRLLPNVNNENSSVGIPKPLASSPRWGQRKPKQKWKISTTVSCRGQADKQQQHQQELGYYERRKDGLPWLVPGVKNTLCVCVGGMDTHWGVCQGTCSWQSCTWPRPPGRMSCTGSSCALESAQQHTSHDMCTFTLYDTNVATGTGFPHQIQSIYANTRWECVDNPIDR